MQPVERKGFCLSQRVPWRTDQDMGHSRKTITTATAAAGVFRKKSQVQLTPVETSGHAAAHATDQVQPDLRVQVRHLGMDRPTQGIGQRIDDPQSNESSRFPQQAGRIIRQELSRLDPGLDAGIKALTDFVQPHTARRSFKQGPTTGPFNRAKLPADRRLGDIAGSGGVRQTAVFCDLQK
jgi:hypothetical protein